MADHPMLFARLSLARRWYLVFYKFIKNINNIIIMTSRIANNVVIIRVLPKIIIQALQKKSLVKNCNFIVIVLHGSVFV